MRKLAYATAGLLVLGASAPALSQNIWISQLYNQVLENGDIMGPAYALDSFGVQRLLPGSKLRITLDVPTNAALTILGDCDEDCIDMNLIAYDAGGRELGADRLDDNFPVINLETGEQSRIELELEMANCDANYCYAAYSVFVGG